VDVVASNWRGVFGAPGINPTQRANLTALMTDLSSLPAWRELLATRGWDNAYLSGPAFEQFLQADTAATESVLRDLGLVT
jgi:putative tricarboxylic transport membrane protein